MQFHYRLKDMEGPGLCTLRSQEGGIEDPGLCHFQVCRGLLLLTRAYSRLLGGAESLWRAPQMAVSIPIATHFWFVIVNPKWVTIIILTISMLWRALHSVARCFPHSRILLQAQKLYVAHIYKMATSSTNSCCYIGPKITSNFVVD